MTEVEGVFDAEYTVAVVTVAILDDHVTEEAEIFIVVLSSSAPNVVIGSGNTSFIVIVDKNAAVVCPNLTEPGNGGVVLSGVSLGDTATFTCTNGYELVGDSVLYCLSGGTWDNSPPVCQGPTVFCPNLMDPANGEVILSGVSVGDTATFTCNAEFELRGDSVLTCLSDITWDKTPPVCQGPTVLFQPTTYTVTEGVDEVVELIVLAENIKTSTITVNVSFFPGSAQATQDFIASSKLIALAPGETEDRVKVPIIDDTIEEDAETFTAVLSVLEITVDVPAAVATVTIIDNDGNDSEKQSTGTIVTLSVIIPVIILASAIIISLLIVFFYQKKRRQHPNRPPVENIYVDPSTFCRQEPTSENPADNFPPKPLLQHSSQLLATEAKYSADTKV
ncbi:Sushi, von Willebrand factor type A, EGF and pentraxin domain-containing protein 1 [Geodia barretti]|uniref:Sushi, von Willebrand factor type A, EGF and pentraxin domain-containing protein 1 n=2 Tax=Geodia barretti TaxID=519541 RepID=A0AA35RVS1_GEOBA|nr:Sushi, von Willebrand factor type A, EGF and pentraxin domain-containing protein 1 [Geodia barretti]